MDAGGVHCADQARSEDTPWRITSSWGGPSYGGAGAPHVRHFIVHTRRAGYVVTRPLNCGVSRMRFIASIFVPLLIVFAVFAGFIVSLVALDEVVTSRYATLADARAEELFARGWLPDILPSSARQIRTTNNLDLSISEGEFRFALGDYDQFSSRLRPYTEVEESGGVVGGAGRSEGARGF